MWDTNSWRLRQCERLSKQPEGLGGEGSGAVFATGGETVLWEAGGDLLGAEKKKYSTLFSLSWTHAVLFDRPMRSKDRAFSAVEVQHHRNLMHRLIYLSISHCPVWRVLRETSGAVRRLNQSWNICRPFWSRHWLHILLIGQKCFVHKALKIMRKPLRVSDIPVPNCGPKGGCCNSEFSWFFSAVPGRCFQSAWPLPFQFAFQKSLSHLRSSGRCCLESTDFQQ